MTAEGQRPTRRRGERGSLDRPHLEVLELDAGEAFKALNTVSNPVQHAPQHPSRTRRNRNLGVRVEVGDEEEGAVVLVRQAPERREVDLGVKVMVAVLLVADEELARVDRVVQVPAKDD